MHSFNANNGNTWSTQAISEAERLVYLKQIIIQTKTDQQHISLVTFDIYVTNKS